MSGHTEGQTRAQDACVSIGPWELVDATEHHGPYIVDAVGSDICDLYAMSNYLAASMRNGGDSYPIEFANARANAAFIVTACNSHDSLTAEVESLRPTVDVLESNARVQAKLLADTGRERDRLLSVLQECQVVLAMMIDPNVIRTTAVMQAYLAAVAAEAKARAALAQEEGK